MKLPTLFKSALAAAALLVSSTASAGTIDLTGGYDVCGTTNSATVCSAKASDGSTGSGTFPSFVGTNGGQDATFYFYNTTGATNVDANAVGNGAPQNRDVTLSDFAVTQFNGQDVVTFVLDINQVAGDTTGLLSLNHISIFVGDGSLTGYNAAADTLGGTAPIWAMTPADTIELDYNLAAGSGRGDMFLYVPVTFFAGLDPLTTHLQLFSAFGDPNANNDGFEEWSYLSCTSNPGAVCYTDDDLTPVPESGTLALFGLGLVGLRRQIMRRRSAIRA